MTDILTTIAGIGGFYLAAIFFPWLREGLNDLFRAVGFGRAN